MLETVEPARALIVYFSTVLVIASGALYILLFTLSHLRKRPGMLILAYACFAVLLANTLVLATLLHLDGYQLTAALSVLLAYLLLPLALRRLMGENAGVARSGKSSCCPPFPANS
ncbi:MAG TPA: hypothetical protein VET88_09175 [Gammaproteobacteria bacterium]|nr:hypothetical protein [Gammaproteobacteria bacterium]